MLVISRRAGERIVIGNDVQVVITDIKRRSVRLGVVGTPDTPILRGEVYDAIEEANRAAANAVFADDGAIEAVLRLATRSKEREGSIPASSGPDEAGPAGAVVGSGKGGAQ